MAEVTAISGEEGNFEVQVLKSPDISTWTSVSPAGCAPRNVPKKVKDEYNEGLGVRKAAYVKYAQAVPLKYVIDEDNCIYFIKREMPGLRKILPQPGRQFSGQAKELPCRSGRSSCSPDFNAYDPTPLRRLCLFQTAQCGHRPWNLNASCRPPVPFMGHLVRPSDHKEPKRIAWLQCVGSRDINHCDHGYCSAVCCMYAIKEAIISKEHSKDGLDCTVFFMDIRSHGKDFERYYNKAKDQGSGSSGPGCTPSIRWRITTTCASPMSARTGRS